MTQNSSDSSKQATQENPWSRTAVSVSVVGAVFGLVFLVLLVGDFVRWSLASQADQDRIAVIKRQLQTAGPGDEQIAAIRQIDLKVRRDMLAWFSFSRRCGLSLVVSVAVFLAGLKAASSLKGPLPRPSPDRDRQDRQVRQGRYAVWSVTGSLTLLGVGAVVATLQPTVGLVEARLQAAAPSAEAFSQNWYRFRGPQGGGVSPYANLVTDWDGPTGKGVLWKTQIPLPGHSSPIVWGDRVFVSGADKDRRQVYCLDVNTGKVLWTGDVPPAPTQGLEAQEQTGLAACTMAADGMRAYAIFATGDLAAFDLAGRLLWSKNLGVPDSAYGYASSLEVFGGRVIVQYDQGQADQGKSRLLAVDGASGQVAWEKTRPVGGSWTSPIVVKVDLKYQVVTAANPWIIAYDPNTGSEIWRASVVAGDMAPSPIYAGGLVLAIEPYSKMVAIRADGQGDVTKSHVAWQSDNGGPDICSPLSDGRYVYLLDTSGMVTVLNLSDGKLVYQQTVEGSFKASPSLVGESLYLLSEKGTLVRVAAGPSFKELGRCELGETCYASPAFANGRVILRGKEHLYCIGAGK